MYILLAKFDFLSIKKMSLILITLFKIFLNFQLFYHLKELNCSLKKMLRNKRFL